MEKKLGWGILATGWIAELFVQDLATAGLKVAACGSRTREKAEAFAQRFGIPKAHGSYEELVADPDVDIVYIATPHPQHVKGAKLALSAGKHVLVEKPFTLNAEEAREIVALAGEKNLIVLEAMWTRFLPHMKRIREIIASGRIGEIRSLSADHRQALSADPSHRLNALELGGGALLDLGIYPISFAFDILGKPTSVSAVARFKDTGADAEVATLMQHDRGAVSTSISASDYAGPNVATVFGMKGRIEIASPWYEPVPFRVIDDQDNVLEDYSEKVEGRGMHFQALELEELVRTGSSSKLMPLSETVEIMSVLDGIRKEIGLVYPGES